ncbi:T9SS type A sorting domain-containing protein [Flavobacterium sp.]|uniref:T9SS type A sorting domain-containing protein n=1 Tax=Flavobacterium sp. TaxID=239 RepID=UPI00286D288A|nr:T9SS type A sorting domain-containing protein [Flavobacterium sp.]
MKKNYTLLFFGLLWSTISFSQIVANDDTYNNLNGVEGSSSQSLGASSVISNDYLNGVGITPSQVQLTQLSTSNPSITLETSLGGYVVVAAGTAVGTYSITYRICQVGNLSNCATGIITVNVCNLPTPTVVSDCNIAVGNIIINGLPSGTWTLYRTDGSSSFFSELTTGSGATYTDTGLSENQSYRYKVRDALGCFSGPTVYQSPGNLDGLQGNVTGTYVDYNNDGITNLGDIIRYDLSITNTLACPMETVTFFISSWPTYIENTIFNLQSNTTDTSGYLNYPLSQNDITNGNVFNWIGIGALSNGHRNYTKISNQNPVTLSLNDGIKMNAFVDINNNGIQDNGEIPNNNCHFNYELNNQPIYHFLYGYDTFLILYETNPSNTYNLSCSFYNYCTHQYETLPTTYSNITVALGSGITTYNFPIPFTNVCQDVAVYLNKLENARPGFPCNLRIEYINYSNQILPSGTITFTKDNLLNIVGISEASATTTVAGFTYNFTDLLPNVSQSITVTVQVPPIPAVALGDQLTNAVAITIPPSDTNALNNNATLTQTITGSLDPNDKTEVHDGKILHSTFTANDYLTYMIRFENTGTAAAINIRVNDVLDAKLDESSIKMVRASHPYVLDRVGSNLNWRFDGVNLSPSIPNDEVTGHGYIIFQVKPKPGFDLGDIIPNTADIFFDFNPAIETNICTTEFVATLGVNAFDVDTFEYYPNPTSDVVSFAFKNTSTTIDTIEVMDILGKTLLSKTINHNDAMIDLSSLEKGIYLVKLNANGQTKTVKISKK